MSALAEEKCKFPLCEEPQCYHDDCDLSDCEHCTECPGCIVAKAVALLAPSGGLPTQHEDAT